MECIACPLDNAYHNGVEYECPDCGATWDDGINFEDDDDDDEGYDYGNDDEEDYEDYEDEDDED